MTDDILETIQKLARYKADKAEPEKWADVYDATTDLLALALGYRWDGERNEWLNGAAPAEVYCMHDAEYREQREEKARLENREP